MDVLYITFEWTIFLMNALTTAIPNLCQLIVDNNLMYDYIACNRYQRMRQRKW